MCPQPPQMKDMKDMQSADCIFMISVSILTTAGVFIVFPHSHSTMIRLVPMMNPDRSMMDVTIRIDGMKITFVCHVHERILM